MAYDLNNKRIQKATEDAVVRQSGEHTLEDQVKSFIDTRVKQATEATGDHKLSYEKWNEIFTEIIRQYKSEQRMPGTGKDADGKFVDFLEVRRPFVNPTSESDPK